MKRILHLSRYWYLDCLDNWQHQLARWMLLRRCLLCRQNVHRELALCDACDQDLPRRRNDDGLVNGELREEQTWAPFHYAFPLDKLITASKFDNDLTAAHTLARLLTAEAIAARIEQPDVIVPVPLHAFRLARRGYNLAGLFSQVLGHRLGVQVAHNMVVRTRYTKPQMGLRAAQRRANLTGAFQAGLSARGLRIAVIDDVITTGATAAAVARCLLEADCDRVEIWALAQAASPVAAR